MHDATDSNSQLAFLQQTLEMSPDGMLLLSGDREIVMINRQLRALLGITAESAVALSFERFRALLLGAVIEEEPFVDFWGRFSAELGLTESVELEIGQPFQRVMDVNVAPVVSATGAAVGSVWVFRDTSDVRGLELSLQQSQKMEAVGRLAGGVAHDFNNLLTVILGNITLLQGRIETLGVPASEDGEMPMKESAEMIRKAAERAADLVRQLLGYSRKTNLTKQVMDLNGICLEVCEFLRRTIGPDIRLSLDLADDLWHAKVDPGQIHQIMMNLCVNAQDAVGEAGEVKIFSRNLSLEEERRASAYHLATGDYIVLSVKDDGEGMSPELQEKIFEPFFTTKEQGKGTGLGLATSIGIIRQHHGWIDCSSVEGKGTIFNVYVPRAVEAVEAIEEETLELDGSGDLATTTADPRTGRRERIGEPTILLIDDEPFVRSVPERLLKRQGYRTLTADDGISGLAMVDEHGDEIDLILLDLTMPNMGGKEVFTQLVQHGCEIPVVICSGYLLDFDTFAEETGAMPAGFVQKPYQLAEFLEGVNQCLDSRSLVN